MPQPCSQPHRPIGGPSAWRGEEFVRRNDWWRELDAEALIELERATESVRECPLESIRCEDFALPSLVTWLAELQRELIFGRGFVLLRGLDVGGYSENDLARLFWGLGTHLGVPRRQNRHGDLLGHVRDVGLSSDDPNVRIFQTNERQGFHTDSADVVGLLCLERAAEGGRSSLVSAVTLHNELLERSPELLQELFKPFCTDHRGEHRADRPPYFTAPIFSWYENELSVLYQRRYIESAQRFADVPRLRPEQVAALNALDAVADDPRIQLQMDLEPGDIQFVHNHGMLHDRTAFRDAADRRRHLLRLWLCPPIGRPLPPWFAERLGSVTVGDRGGVPL